VFVWIHSDIVFPHSTAFNTFETHPLPHCLECQRFLEAMFALGWGEKGETSLIEEEM
jgi:hypothetical protein